MIIKIEKLFNDQLTNLVYSFRFSDGYGNQNIVFEKYLYQTRETKRHKFVNKDIWTRQTQRKNTIENKDIQNLVPSFIILEAKQKLKEMIDNTEVKFPKECEWQDEN